MNKNLTPLFLLVLALALVGSLFLTGCSANRAAVSSEIESQPTDLAELEDRAAEFETKSLILEAQLEQALAAEPQLLTVPAGTLLELDLVEALSSEESLVGDTVTGTVAVDLLLDGAIAIPAGSQVRGAVLGATPTRRIGGQAALVIAFDTLILDDGTAIEIESTLELLGQRQKKRDAATIGGSAAGGAILGRVLTDNNRDEGTAVGMIVGAAIGTIIAARNQADPVILAPGAQLAVELGAPLTVVVTERS